MRSAPRHPGRLTRRLTLSAAAAIVLAYLLTPALHAWHLATEHAPQRTKQTGHTATSSCSHSHSHNHDHAPLPADRHDHDEGGGSCAVCEGFLAVRQAIYGSFDPPIGVLSPTAEAPAAALALVAPSTADLSSYPSRGPPRA